MSGIKEYAGYDILVYKNTRSAVPTEQHADLCLSLSNTDQTSPYYYPSTTRVYINTLPFAVVVVEASGKRFTVPAAKHDTYSNKFVIREYLKISNASYKEMLVWLRDQIVEAEQRAANTSDPENRPEKHFPQYRLAKQLMMREQSDRGMHIGLAALYQSGYFEDYVVASDVDFGNQIIAGKLVHNRTIYHQPTTTSISCTNIADAELNPNDALYSSMDRLEYLDYKFKIGPQDAVIRFEMVSKDARHAKRYIKLGNRIETIMPKAEEPLERNEGIYCTYMTRDEINPLKYKAHTEFCTFDEAEGRYGIYTNIEQAESDGFQDVRMQSKLKDLEQKLVNSNNKIESQKMQQEAEKNKAEIESRKYQDKIESLNKEIEAHKKMIAHLEDTIAYARNSDEKLREIFDKERAFFYEQKAMYEEEVRNSNKQKDEKTFSFLRFGTDALKIISTIGMGMLGIFKIVKK